MTGPTTTHSTNKNKKEATMDKVISSFGYNGIEGEESLTHVTINDIELIKEAIPKSNEHFALI